MSRRISTGRSSQPGGALRRRVTLRWLLGLLLGLVLGSAAVGGALGCSPCQAFFADSTLRPAHERYERQGDGRAVVDVHAYKPTGVETEFFNPHEVVFDEDTLDLGARPPVIRPVVIRDLEVALNRPLPEGAFTGERDFEIGVPIGEAEVSEISQTESLELGTPPRPVTVTFTLRREHRMMQMYRILYVEAIEPLEETARRRAAADARQRSQIPARRWVSSIDVPQPFRQRDVTTRVEYVATLDDFFDGLSPSTNEVASLVGQIEDASTPLFRELYRALVLPEGDEEAADENVVEAEAESGREGEGDSDGEGATDREQSDDRETSPGPIPSSIPSSSPSDPAAEE